MLSPGASFYFDLASPLAYIVAELIGQTLPGAEWQPVLARELPGSRSAGESRGSRGSLGGGHVSSPDAAEIERLAAAAGLLPVRWPEGFPFDSERAMLAATYAKSIGRTVAFAQAAFRQAYAGGRDLSREDDLLVATAACELHPRAVRSGAGSARVRGLLRETTADAAGAGVSGVPALRIGERVFVGVDALERARTARAATTPDGRETAIA